MGFRHDQIVDIEVVIVLGIGDRRFQTLLYVDRLVVSKAEVGRAQVMKRFHARGRGRSARVEKWFSHLKIVVAEQQLAEQEAA